MKLHKEARQFIKDSLNDRVMKLPESNQRIFRLMYGRDDGERSVEDAEKLPINAVIDEMSDEKLNWAMTQVENSMRKLQSVQADED